MNRDFDSITGHLVKLEKAGFLKAKMMRTLDAFTREVQAEINVQTLSNLRDEEDKDWSRFGKVRNRIQKEIMKQP
jgi:hypothetical protein